MTLKEYSPSPIKQLPELKKTYKGKNPAGGRRIPVNFIGAAGTGPLSARWKQGIKSNSEVRVKLTTNTDQLILTPWPDR